MHKTELNKCTVYKKFNVRPWQKDIAPLRDDCINEAPLFSATGLDYAGPLYVKRKENKCSILLLTCAIIRAPSSRNG